MRIRPAREKDCAMRAYTHHGGRMSGGIAEIRIRKLEKQEDGKGPPGGTNTYLVTEKGREFLITYASHPHHGSSLSLAGQEGTLHLRTEDNSVVRQVVALGGGCALAIHEEVVEGLSPVSLRAVITAERTRETGEITLSSKGFENCSGQT
jgi:hypothetical protein